MAGNPDQQEDNVDEQYQEEGEEEVGRGGGRRPDCLGSLSPEKTSPNGLSLKGSESRRLHKEGWFRGEMDHSHGDI